MNPTDREMRCEDYDTKPGVYYHALDLPRCTERNVLYLLDDRWLCARHREQRITTDRRLQK